MEDYDVTPFNAFCFQRWMQLNITGRNFGMGGMEGLREEAIQSILFRYECNDPSVYETILTIETRMFEFLKKEEGKKSEAKKLKAKTAKKPTPTRARRK